MQQGGCSASYIRPISPHCSKSSCPLTWLLSASRPWFCTRPLPELSRPTLTTRTSLAPLQHASRAYGVCLFPCATPLLTPLLPEMSVCLTFSPPTRSLSKCHLLGATYTDHLLKTAAPSNIGILTALIQLHYSLDHLDFHNNLWYSPPSFTEI